MIRRRCAWCGEVKAMDARHRYCGKRCAGHANARKRSPESIRESQRKAVAGRKAKCEATFAARYLPLVRAVGLLAALKKAYGNGYEAGRMARRYYERSLAARRLRALLGTQNRRAA